MNTEKLFLVKDSEMNFDFCMTEEHSEYCLQYVLFSRLIQEIQQLFSAFQFNLQQLEDYCIVYYNDKVISKKTGQSIVPIEINVLTVNIISAGKSLVETIELFLKNYMSDIASDFKKNSLSEKYDSNFNYRFGLFLRNFSQHGHLCICNSSDGGFAFDIDQILCTPHYNFNNAMEKELQNINNEVLEKYGKIPTLSYVKVMEQYTLSIYEIYVQYYAFIKDKVSEWNVGIQSMLKDNPDYIIVSNEALEGAVPFDLADDGGVSIFYSSDNFWNMYIDFQKEAKNYLKEYKRIIERESIK